MKFDVLSVLILVGIGIVRSILTAKHDPPTYKSENQDADAKEKLEKPSSSVTLRPTIHSPKPTLSSQSNKLASSTSDRLHKPLLSTAEKKTYPPYSIKVIKNTNRLRKTLAKKNTLRQVILMTELLQSKTR